MWVNGGGTLFIPILVHYCIPIDKYAVGSFESA